MDAKQTRLFIEAIEDEVIFKAKLSELLKNREAEFELTPEEKDQRGIKLGLFLLGYANKLLQGEIQYPRVLTKLDNELQKA